MCVLAAARPFCCCFATHNHQVYLSVDALVNRGSLDLVGALLEANRELDSLSPEALKQRRARQHAEAAAAAAAADGKTRQIAK